MNREETPMDLLSSWQSDLLEVIKLGEWVLEIDIHRRVVERRAAYGKWGIVAGLVSLFSPETAKRVLLFVSADRTLWGLALLVHTRALYVRQTDELPPGMVGTTEMPIFEYCLGENGAHHFRERELNAGNLTLALA